MIYEYICSQCGYTRESEVKDKHCPKCNTKLEVKNYDKNKN